MFNYRATAGSKTIDCQANSDGSVRFSVTPLPGCTIEGLRTTIRNGVCFITDKYYEGELDFTVEPNEFVTKIDSDSCSVKTDGSIQLKLFGLSDLQITVAKGTVTVTNKK